MKELIKRIPVLGDIVKFVSQKTRYRNESWPPAPESFENSEAYWKERYAIGGVSGNGSYGKLAAFKAKVLNEFVAKHRIQTVIEFGCGDGNQLRLTKYPHYIGFDVSEVAVERCRGIFASDAAKSFRLTSEYAGDIADLSLSLDVIYHLVEDDIL